MLNRDVARKLLAVEDLPTLPVVMTQLLDAVENDASNADDLTAILEKDLAISSRVLRLANSAFYGLRHKVDSLRRAVIVIGFDAVRMLALATSVFDAFSRQKQFAFDPEEFWMHSLGAAKAAQLLSKQVPGIASAEGCFTAGLLHDIGKYCLALALKEEYAAAVRRAQQEQTLLKICEQEMLGATHADIGAWLAEKWRLPEMISDGIRYHDQLQEYTGAYAVEVAIVSAANILSLEAGFGHAGDYGPLTIEDASVSLKLDQAQLESIRESLGGYTDEARRFLGVLKAD